MFLVDTSSYIGRDDFGKVKNFIGKIIDKLALYGDHSRVAVVTFSDEVSWHCTEIIVGWLSSHSATSFE